MGEHKNNMNALLAKMSPSMGSLEPHAQLRAAPMPKPHVMIAIDSSYVREVDGKKQCKDDDGNWHDVPDFIKSIYIAGQDIPESEWDMVVQVGLGAVDRTIRDSRGGNPGTIAPIRELARVDFVAWRDSSRSAITAQTGLII